MDEIMRIFDTNVFATIRTAKAVIPHMAARKRGTVVNVGSIAGNIPIPWGGGVYSATKATLHSLTDMLYMECNFWLHIHVVLLAPGAVRSNIAANKAPRIRLPPDSLYADYADAVLKCLAMSQANNPLPADAIFARTTVDAVLRPGGGGAEIHELGEDVGLVQGVRVVAARVGVGLVLEVDGRGPGPRKAAQKTK